MSDLEEAINRLRGSIGSLNKEGRERLMAVFTQVDQHFQSLFTRMFGGGRAILALSGVMTRWKPGWKSMPSHRAKSWPHFRSCPEVNKL